MGVVHHMRQLWETLQTLGIFSRENLKQVQQTQAQQYNKGARLILLPSTKSKLLAKWQGPFEVTWQIGPVNYEFRLSD